MQATVTGKYFLEERFANFISVNIDISNSGKNPCIGRSLTLMIIDCESPFM